MEREDAILKGLLEIAEKTTINDSYQIPYEITKETDMWFVILPQWSEKLPPFNLARLSSILLTEGYLTKCLDLNVKAWNILEQYHDELGYDPWDGAWTFKWKGQTYWDEIHPYLNNFLNGALQEIIKAKPKVVGFSVYWTNTQLVFWMKNELKKYLPDTVFVAGGPSTHSDAENLLQNFDVVVVGEAEKLIVTLLDEVENGTLDKNQYPIRLTQPSNERIDLNIHPIPNYSDFDINDYKIPNGMISEFSRGCVAKCTFCEETHFWNFRQRGYLSLVDELEHLNKQFGMNAVWFVDSLVNGSIKELRMFCEEVVKRDLKIQWFGFGRHDKRMDLEYMHLLKASGCVGFQYGSESGNNRVLQEINKRITKEDMEQNFIDGEIAGIESITGWIISFPTETTNDFIDTLTLIWRNRNTSITNLIAGTRFHYGPNTIVAQNPPKFGLMTYTHEGCHIREDLTMSLPSVTVRGKAWSMFCYELRANKKINFAQRPNVPIEHYSIEYINRKLFKEIEFEEFDYNIYNSNRPFVDSVVNELLGTCRFLWRTRGGYKLQMNFSKEMQLKDFGPSLAPNLNGRLIFQITDAGKWKYDIDLEYKQDPYAWQPLSYMWASSEEHSVKRARQHAKPEWGTDGLSEEKKQEIIETAKRMNQEYDLSFKVADVINGDWGVKVKNKSLF